MSSQHYTLSSILHLLFLFFDQLASNRGCGLTGCWCSLVGFQWVKRTLLFFVIIQFNFFLFTDFLLVPLQFRFFMALRRLLSPNGMLYSEDLVQKLKAVQFKGITVDTYVKLKTQLKVHWCRVLVALPRGKNDPLLLLNSDNYCYCAGYCTSFVGIL